MIFLKVFEKGSIDLEMYLGLVYDSIIQVGSEDRGYLDDCCGEGFSFFVWGWGQKGRDEWDFRVEIFRI